MPHNTKVIQNMTVIDVMRNQTILKKSATLKAQVKCTTYFLIYDGKRYFQHIPCNT